MRVKSGTSSTSMGTPALPCLSILSRASEEMYTVSEVSTWLESAGGPPPN